MSGCKEVDGPDPRHWVNRGPQNINNCPKPRREYRGVRGENVSVRCDTRGVIFLDEIRKDNLVSSQNILINIRTSDCYQVVYLSYVIQHCEIVNVSTSP